MVSVILCTHNPKSAYIKRTIEGLRQQTLSPDEWELLVIDNRSDEPLQDRLELSWHKRAHVIREEKLGLTPARLRGIREANGDLLVFVDDDNVLDPDFLEVAQRIARERIFLGAWSGQCRGKFDESPPEWTRRYWGNLAIREFDKDCWSNLPRLPETMPCGAGMCVRREVAAHYLELNESGKRGFQFDRTGDSLVSGGDNDLAACSCDVGLGVGIVTALRLQHIIPPERLTVEYLARLAEGIHFSSALLDAERGLPVIAPSRGRRLLDKARWMTLSQHDKVIQEAALRGRNRAIDVINSQKRS
ncbi:glycosyltransferase family 2 protein [bacterium]|nr:glycosyltransferase family 2 protein [bacterium]